MHGKRPVYILIVVVTLLILCVADAQAVSWTGDLEAALKQAKESRRPIMMDFYTTWCGWCKELDRNTYSDSKVNNILADFICVKIDAEKNPQLAFKYDVRGYPTVVFLNYDGSVASSIIGYRAPEAFISAMGPILKKTKTIKGKVEAKTNSPVLSGIIANKQKAPVAIIDNAFVREGDAITGGKVSKITKDKVEIIFQKKTITLTME